MFILKFPFKQSRLFSNINLIYIACKKINIANYVRRFQLFNIITQQCLIAPG